MKSIHSGDIHDQGRKLSEIAPNFVRFCSPKFCWGASKSCTQIIRPAWGTSPGTVSWGYSH